MQIAFKLSMPNIGSWDSKWSGEGRTYAIVRAFRKPPTDREGKPIATDAGRYYHYNFGDGWAAAVWAEIVNAAEARRLRRVSAGFAGYDWMVDSILRHGRIVAPSEAS